MLKAERDLDGAVTLNFMIHVHDIWPCKKHLLFEVYGGLQREIRGRQKVKEENTYTYRHTHTHTHTHTHICISLSDLEIRT
jgi:hypothetical protein